MIAQVSAGEKRLRPEHSLHGPSDIKVMLPQSRSQCLDFVSGNAFAHKHLAQAPGEPFGGSRVFPQPRSPVLALPRPRLPQNRLLSRILTPRPGAEDTFLP